MIGWDPLGAAERTAVAEEIVSALRHDLRNRIATIRNAAFYIKRKVSREEVYQKDPRIEQFFKIIDEEVLAASSLTDEPVAAKLLFCRRIMRVNVGECVRSAAACSRITHPGIRVDVDAADGEIEIDAVELSLAVRCLVENAAESMACGGVVTLHGRVDGERYFIEVGDTGAGVPEADRDAITRPFYTTKPGHVGLGLNIAERVARRYMGTLTMLCQPTGTWAILKLLLVASPGQAAAAAQEPP